MSLAPLANNNVDMVTVMQMQNGRYPMVTSVECGGAVDVSSDEGGLLFPDGVVPHPSDAALYTAEMRKEEGKGGKK